jgi:hypothetical protein
MPMIDVYATAGTFPDAHQLAADLAAAIMTINRHSSRVCTGDSFLFR